MAQRLTDKGRVILQADIALYHSEVQFRRLLEKLPAGAYTCDAAGLITYFNQNAARLWGREPKINDPVDRFCGSFKLFSADGAPINHSQCWMALALEKNSEYNGQEIIVERPDGSRATVLAHANPIHDEAGNLTGAVNVLVNITDRKLAEDGLKETDRIKNEFIATLAHELRNPLAPIRNALQVLQLEDDSSTKLQWARDLIDRQMQHMTRLTDDLLDLARITSNKIELRKEKISLARVINAAAEISRPLMDEREQKFTIDMPAEPFYFNGDLTRLAQVISNLLNNSSKYTPPGGSIGLKTEIQNGEAAIMVEDSGIGIAAEKMPHIFDMFAQAGQSSDKIEGGLGIGLTLVRRIVEMHQGRVDVSSGGEGQGSVFTVRLPVFAEGDPASTPVTPATPEPNTGDKPAVKRRILVADDNQDCAESLAMVLEMTGHEVVTAGDGLEALELIVAFQPEIAFLDIGMPNLNGYEAARSIRENHGPDILLIAVSGWGQEEDRRRSKEAGFDHHLIKPINFDALDVLLA